MTPAAAHDFVLSVYTIVLGRTPKDAEREHWIGQLVSSALTPEAALRAFANSAEYKAKHAVEQFVPPGHYYSPIVDPKTVRAYVAREKENSAQPIPGIPLDVAAMRRIWLQHLDFTRTSPFTEQPNGTNRYDFGTGPFPEGDGITLRMMFAHLRPRRVIEIGSGYSSACMLDSADHLGLTDFRLTCIEPYPDRLRSVLRPGDDERVTILETEIQKLPAWIVDDLEANDILFIDSTHVLKTGSDVHYELFELLPRLKPGVIVHFHDIQYPFEYPDEWIFQKNYSWNEIYALRAFLMFQNRFRVMYWNHLLWHMHSKQMREEFPLTTANPGGSIWIECLAH